MERNVVGPEAIAPRPGARMTEPAAIIPSDAHRGRRRTVSQFAYVDRAFRDVRRHVASAPTRILGDGPPEASGGPDEPTAGLHVRRAGLDLVRDVRMVLGDLEVGVQSARLPLRWEDAAHPDLFPILDATFELSPVSAGHPMTQLGLFGQYQPPFGRFGSLADTLAGRRIVLESVERFLDELARRLERELPATEPDAARPDSRPTQGWRRVILPVDGLNRRPGGAAGVQLHLEAIPGVSAVSINPGTGLAVIDYDQRSCSVHDLQKALDDASEE
jgi:hypothetical protein